MQLYCPETLYSVYGLNFISTFTDIIQLTIFFYKPNHFNTMNVDDVKQDIKNKIAEINRSFPKYGIKSKEIRGDNIPLLQYRLVGISGVFKVYTVFLFIFLIIIAGLSSFSYTIKVFEIFKGSNLLNDFDVKKISELKNSPLLDVFTILWAIITFKIFRIKENLMKKIFLLQLMDKMDK